MSSQVGESPWTTLQLTRFSHATNENLNPAHVNWVHIPERDDLVLVLDFAQVMGPDGQWQDSKVLKVLRGAVMMERLDLKALVRVAVVEEARIREQKLPISEARVSTLIRSPCVAIRYTTAENKVRRFQLRFPSHQVFENAVSILNSIGLPLHQALPPNLPSARTVSLRPDSSSQSRPTSNAQEQLISSQGTLSVAKSPELPPKLVENEGPHRIASLSSLLPSPTFLRDSSMPEPRSNFNFGMPPPDFRHRSAGTMSSAHQVSAANAQGSSLQVPEALPRPATTPAFVPQTPDSLSQVLPPRRILPFDPPANGPISKITDISATIESTQSQEAANPSEPPATKKPATKSRKQPAKAKPKPVKPPKATKGKKGDVVPPTTPETTSSGPSGLHTETNEMTDAPDTIPTTHPIEPALPAPSLGAAPSESNSTSRQRPSAEMDLEPPNSHPPPSTVCTTCHRPLLTPTTETRQTTAPSQPHPANPPLGAVPPSPDDISSSHPTHNEPALPPSHQPPNATATSSNNPPHLPPPTTNNPSLAAYAAQPDADRLAQLDTFLAQSLVDDDFLTLCEDVERSWRRIGLGTGSGVGSGASHAAGGARVSQRIAQIARVADAVLLENLCCD